MIHKAVLLKELIENLNLKPGMTVVDGTLGAGGHSLAALKKILPGGKLISIDWDKHAVEQFENFLVKKGIAVSANERKIKASLAKAGRASPAPVTSNAYGEIISPQAFTPLFLGDKIVGHWSGASANYANLDSITRGLGLRTADAIFVDLGFSSDQIEDPQRGFSFLLSGPASNASRSNAGWPLDMRYSPETEKMTAADIVNKYSEEKLIEIFRNYGEERHARKIAKSIVRARKTREIRTTQDLVEILSHAVPEGYKKIKIHFATKVFQALRIEVNRELENLEKFLPQALGRLVSGGRLAVISFHSLEDRIVKNYFRQESKGCVCPPNFPKCVCDHQPKLEIITKKPITATEQETHENPRARSAKLRVAEKIA